MLNELAKQLHENAKAHGWWDEERNFGEIIALCHSELSEALEEYRDDKPMLYCDMFGVNGVKTFVSKYENGYKPEGIAVEMADCIIRILDWFGKEGIDIDEIMRIKMRYNETRPHRHGGKKA